MAMARAGQMRHRITIERYSEGAPDPETGIPGDPEWNPVYTNIAAAYRPLTAREVQAAGARQAQTTSEFEIPTGLDITEADRIVFDGNVWEIDGIRYDETRARRMKIGAHKGLTDG